MLRSNGTQSAYKITLIPFCGGCAFGPPIYLARPARAHMRRRNPPARAGHAEGKVPLARHVGERRRYRLGLILSKDRDVENPSLATKNLLEDTDGLRRPPP